jgi:hypothetical protein
MCPLVPFGNLVSPVGSILRNVTVNLNGKLEPEPEPELEPTVYVYATFSALYGTGMACDISR